MTRTDLAPREAAIEAEIAALARRYRSASGPGVQLLNLVGGKTENLLERLPDPVKDGLEGATARALQIAFEAAARSRGSLPDGNDWLNRAVTTAMGAAGGFGGLPGALAELPVTTTVLLRAIQGIAAEHGFDPAEPEIRAGCIEVFAAAGPLAGDDGADLGFLAARVTLTGQTVQALIARVAPRLARVLGQKLAAQAVPVLGAVAGAATNYTYTSYYQEMARVSFGLRRLSEERGAPHADLVAALRRALARP